MGRDLVHENWYKILTEDVRVRGTASSLSTMKLFHDELEERAKLQKRQQSGGEKNEGKQKQISDRSKTANPNRRRGGQIYES